VCDLQGLNAESNKMFELLTTSARSKLGLVQIFI